MDKGKRATLAVVVALICLAIGNMGMHANVALVYFVAVLAAVAVWLLTGPRKA